MTIKPFIKKLLFLLAVFNGLYAQKISLPGKLKKVEKENHKLVIYQLFVRLFGNDKKLNKVYGTIKENGCGKFDDVDDAALKAIKKFGATHIWAFGVLDHMTMTDYSTYKIPNDNPWLVKGKAGSPFAVKDYYDVAPDLAVSVPNRMAEFEDMVKRIHANDLKVIIDFVPNHVARNYHSSAKPKQTEDFGEKDDTSKNFDPNNNFYYLNGPLQGFEGVNLPEGVVAPLWVENPAKATGNDVFNLKPNVNDWYETIKLNYGVDYQNGRVGHFSPIPNTWLKMKDILAFWAKKNVDGVRCDMAEMVPVEFWEWVIPQIKAIKPGFTFIAEIYNPNEYHNYIHKGKFDYLYDKVGVYDALRRLMQGGGDANDLTRLWQIETNGIEKNMLRFLENHDEQRIASEFFAKDPDIAIPAMTISATMHPGPILIYNGQEFGEQGMSQEGFHGANGPDGRTTLFDYWGVENFQNWRNKGKYDGKKLSPNARKIQGFYQRLNLFSTNNHAISSGAFYDLQYANKDGQSVDYESTKVYSFIRHSFKQKLLIIANFDLNRSYHTQLHVPSHAWETMNLDPEKSYSFTEVFQNQPLFIKIKKGIHPLHITLPANSVFIFEIK